MLTIGKASLCVQCCAGAVERVCLAFGRHVCSAERPQVIRHVRRAERVDVSGRA